MKMIDWGSFGGHFEMLFDDFEAFWISFLVIFDDLGIIWGHFGGHLGSFGALGGHWGIFRVIRISFLLISTSFWSPSCRF